MSNKVCTAWFNGDGLRDAVVKACVDPMDKAAMLVEAEVKKSMKSGGGAKHRPSPPGTPPHVQSGHLRASITWARIHNGLNRIIGPQRSVAWYGAIHEFGLMVKNKLGGVTHFPMRPFMWPALLRCRHKFAPLFRGLNIKRYYRDNRGRLR